MRRHLVVAALGVGLAAFAGCGSGSSESPDVTGADEDGSEPSSEEAGHRIGCGRSGHYGPRELRKVYPRGLPLANALRIGPVAFRGATAFSNPGNADELRKLRNLPRRRWIPFKVGIAIRPPEEVTITVPDGGDAGLLLFVSPEGVGHGLTRYPRSAGQEAVTFTGCVEHRPRDTFLSVGELLVRSPGCHRLEVAGPDGGEPAEGIVNIGMGAGGCREG